jgi:endonuclease YncB( thermonuclease family)
MTTKTPTLKKRSWQGAALVREIIDGDTLKCDVDLGFKIWITTNVRVHGCNSPELPTRLGILAKDFTEACVKIGDVVSLDSKRIDKYGRPEAAVTLPDGRDLGALLIGSGHASAADDRGNLQTAESQPGVLPGLAPRDTRSNTAHQ